jgi:hypothetical protein
MSSVWVERSCADMMQMRQAVAAYGEQPSLPPPGTGDRGVVAASFLLTCDTEQLPDCSALESNGCGKYFSFSTACVCALSQESKYMIWTGFVVSSKF